MKPIDDYDEHGEEEFELPDHLDTEDIRDTVIAYAKAADRYKLIQMLTLSRDLFFER